MGEGPSITFQLLAPGDRCLLPDVWGPVSSKTNVAVSPRKSGKAARQVGNKTAKKKLTQIDVNRQLPGDKFSLCVCHFSHIWKANFLPERNKKKKRKYIVKRKTSENSTSGSGVCVCVSVFVSVWFGWVFLGQSFPATECCSPATNIGKFLWGFATKAEKPLRQTFDDSPHTASLSSSLTGGVPAFSPILWHPFATPARNHPSPLSVAMKNVSWPGWLSLLFEFFPTFLALSRVFRLLLLLFLGLPLLLSCT